MLVENLMTRDPESCRPDSTLAEAAAVMWRRDCGVVPVTGDDGRVVGVVTDRDICMALSMRGQRAGDVRVGEVMEGGAVETCTPVDDVREALELMKRRQVRRLPVVDSRGKLVGLLSINDVIRHTRKAKGKRRVSRRDTLAALKAICRPHGAGEEEGATSAAEHYDEVVFTLEAGDDARPRDVEGGGDASGGSDSSGGGDTSPGDAAGVGGSPETDSRGKASRAKASRGKTSRAKASRGKRSRGKGADGEGVEGA